MCSSSLVVYFIKFLFFLPVIYYSVLVSSYQNEYIVCGPLQSVGEVSGQKKMPAGAVSVYESVEYNPSLQFGFVEHVARATPAGHVGDSPQIAVMVWVSGDIAPSGQQSALFVFINVIVTSSPAVQFNSGPLPPPELPSLELPSPELPPPELPLPPEVEPDPVALVGATITILSSVAQ